MTAEQIPREVVRFLVENIDSVPHLEALLLIWQSAPETWNAERIAARCYITPRVAATLLEDLTRRGLLVRAPTQPPAYGFDATYDAERNIMGKVAESYRTQLVRIANLIHTKASGAVRDFARAFKLSDDT